MAAGRTYTPIATQTATGSSSNITFSSIPSTYTDLVLVVNASAAATDFYLRYNGDTGTNYSQTILKGNGSAASSTRNSNASLIYIDWSGFTINSIQNNAVIHIMNYANTTTYKTAVHRFNDASNTVETHISLWRSTATINSVSVIAGGSFTSGSTFTLYGIAAA